MFTYSVEKKVFAFPEYKKIPLTAESVPNKPHLIKLTNQDNSLAFNFNHKFPNGSVVAPLCYRFECDHPGINFGFFSNRPYILNRVREFTSDSFLDDLGYELCDVFQGGCEDPIYFGHTGSTVPKIKFLFDTTGITTGTPNSLIDFISQTYYVSGLFGENPYLYHPARDLFDRGLFNEYTRKFSMLNKNFDLEKENSLPLENYHKYGFEERAVILSLYLTNFSDDTPATVNLYKKKSHDTLVLNTMASGGQDKIDSFLNTGLIFSKQIEPKSTEEIPIGKIGIDNFNFSPMMALLGGNRFFITTDSASSGMVTANATFSMSLKSYSSSSPPEN